MDTSGIEVLSVKSLEANHGLGQVNRGYLHHDDVSNDKTASTVDVNGSGGGDASVRIAAGEAQYLKKDSSSVDFTLPEKNGNNRSKSLGGDDNYHYKERSKSISESSHRERSKSISDGPYRGMGKEELLRYSSRPLWRNLRYACMSVVLTGWLALLITVVALVLTYPSCREAQRKDWWQKTVIYRIYVRSYFDTDGDGFGDLRGIKQKLDYLKETGVDTISLSPIYKLANGSETDTHIVDHKEIDAVFGSMSDFRSLVNETHQRGMHIMIDFIPNHTSDQHPWFRESKSNTNPRVNMLRSYYVWAPRQEGNNVQPPNNWRSVYDSPAWTIDQTPPNSQYLHQFLDSQPDLNLRSEKVRVELEEILQFWLNEGVDGFYIRDSDFLFEDYDLRDDILVDNNTIKACSDNTPQSCLYESYRHEYTRGLHEVFDMLARWRAFLDDKGNETGKYKILMADVEGSYSHVMDYYGLFNRDGVDFPLNHFSLKLNLSGNGQDVTTMVNTWMSQMPAGRWANWMGGDDRSPRLADRLGENMAMPYLMLTMLLPGTPYLYYGDEIGMRESPSYPADTWSRNMSMRGPMLWNSDQWADFCNCGKPWMALNPNHRDQMNVEAQKANPYSMWHLFKNLTSLRKSSPSFEYGDYVPSIQDDEVFSFVREFDGERGYLVALNFVNRTVRKYLTGTHDTIPGGATIEVISGVTSRQRGDGLGLDPVTLEPYQGVVVSWEYEAKEL